MKFLCLRPLAIILFLFASTTYAEKICGTLSKPKKETTYLQAEELRQYGRVQVIPLNKEVDEKLPESGSKKTLCVWGTVAVPGRVDIGRLSVGGGSTYLTGQVIDAQFLAYAAEEKE